jgi:hypothetical protein
LAAPDLQRIGGEIRVNTSTAGRQFDPIITQLETRNFLVVWSDNSSTNIYAQLFDNLGTAIGSEFLVNTSSAQTQDKPNVSALQDGGFAITWRDFSAVNNSSAASNIDIDVKVQIFSAQGIPTGPEIMVPNVTYGAQTNPEIEGLSNGNFVVLWFHNAETLTGGAVARGIKAQVFSPDGSKVGDEIVVSLARLPDDSTAKLKASLTDVLLLLGSSLKGLQVPPQVMKVGIRSGRAYSTKKGCLFLRN